jgi:dTDP-4-amino-4,6-dideoxygalactose transaminase
MRVPLLDLRPQLADIEAELKAAVLDVVESTRYVMGPKVELFEEAAADYVGSRYAIGVSSGTDALLASLMALGVGAGDRVVTTAYSFFATVGVIARLGATPVFADIDPDTLNLDPGALRASLEGEGTDRVRAIVPAHLFGQCADMDPILEVAGARGIPVVEDAAQAIGAHYPSRKGGRRAGSLGALGCFSFFPSKNLGALGDGGLVVTDDAQLRDQLVCLRDHGSRERYHHTRIGGNFRLDAIQAAALLVKLPLLERWNEARRHNAAYYDEEIGGVVLRTPVAAWGRGAHVYNQYVIDVSERRDELRRFLAEREIGTEVYYPIPFHLQECFASLGHSRGDFPNAEFAAEHTLALPVYPGLTREMQDHVVGAIRAFYA